MYCHICKEVKLSKEFVLENLSISCDHEPLFCMQCAVKVKQTGKCPYTDCLCKVPRNSEKLELYDAILKTMFPQFKFMLEAEQGPVVPVSGSHIPMGSMVSVALLTGESFMCNISPKTSVTDLKQSIFQKQGTPVSKQKLIYKEKELEARKTDGNLALLKDYGVQNNSHISLLVMMFSIPETFHQVTFDLNWGYPRRGKDYLDASCLVFSGYTVLYAVDFHNKHDYRDSPIKHSGDVMNHHKKRGHHTIDVDLSKLPDNVTHLFFTLSAWNSPTLRPFRSPSLKFYETAKKNVNLCGTSFQHALFSEAVVMCSVSKRSGVWEIFRSGTVSAGNAANYGPLILTIRNLIASGV